MICNFLYSSTRRLIGGIAATLLILLNTNVAQAEDDKFAPILEKVKTCVACHGPEGVPLAPQFPILSGQHLYYLYVQLKDYKSGFRANPIMQPIAAGLEKKEMLLIAEYFSLKSWPEKPRLEPDPMVKNAALLVITAGQCVACHLSGFEGNSRVPYTAGQNYEYLLSTLQQFKSKERGNSPSKGSLMASFEDAEIKSLARYLSSLKPGS